MLFKDQQSTERTVPKMNEKLLGFTEVSGHVGSSYDPAISKLPANTSRVGTHAPEIQLKSPFKRNRLVHKGGKLGPDLLAQSILKEQTKESGPSFLIDPFTVELEANNISSTAVVQNCPEELETGQTPRMNTTEKIHEEREGREMCTPQRLEENNSSLISIEEAVPLNQKNLEEEDDPEFDMPIWIHQNILKFAKDFGVDIKGCKEEAKMLFMKIDSMRQINNDKGKEIAKLTSAVKGAKELKSLECGSIFRSNGTRSKGDTPSQASKRSIIKNLIHSWKADIYCFQETKIEGEIGSFVKDLWANRWVKYCQLEASGTRGERWKIIPTCIWWSVWKERNLRCFQNKSNNIQKMKMNCLVLFHFWCKQEYMEDLESVMNALGTL
ncbi:hypothetical protein H5410_027432 [Solanum commersonii]|uniref:Uncharacterized protein n=1 Tax=Solanum commersonii TaxID=4109 RepID=A0A9J5Z3C5_SOLCO|nr:hypothetical protein H5410_027432 [Solanum commersonii]